MNPDDILFTQWRSSCPHCKEDLGSAEDRTHQRLIKIDYWITCLEHVFGWLLRATFNGFTMRREKDGWLLIVRARVKGKNVVCFILGQTVADTFLHLASRVRDESMDWHTDRYS